MMQGRMTQLIVSFFFMILPAIVMAGDKGTPQKAVQPQVETLDQNAIQDFYNPVPDQSPLLQGAKQIFLVVPETNRVLLEKNGDEKTPPSSMTKIATLMMVFEQLQSGQLSLDDTFSVSVNAWKKEGSRMFLEPNTQVRVEDLIRGIVVQSGNDATTVVAEGLAGDERQFADQMTERLKELGLQNTNFVNASGLPSPDHYSTARDLALMGVQMIRLYPQFYHYFGEKSFKYNNIHQANRNQFLFRSPSHVDGIKTGITDAAGYGIVASAAHDGMRFILVLNGCESDKDRFQVGEKIFKWAFREYKNQTLFEAGQILGEARIWLGAKKTVSLMVPERVRLTLSQKEHKHLKVTYHYNDPIEAPVKQGVRVGDLVIEAPGNKWVYPVVAGETVNEVGFFGRAISALYYTIWGASA
ncbi:MAG: D-alanyl-D-alanine carboxypeptidase [Alphaproteobacteria bacterium]|nr:MAG: D-alanyl-D-alanine carboxypeptidase [Alphaproteobacteria bacterium]